MATDTKRRILEHAAQIASSDGLEALTIGRLADDLGMSKAGLYGHFGSKERLQLETVALGREIFRAHVIAPAEDAPAGLPRLWTICEAYLSYVEDEVFAGGDFFVTVAHEYEARDGAVRDVVAGAIEGWLGRLEALVADAIGLGHLAPTDPRQLAFEVEALLVAGSHLFRMYRDPQALSRAWSGISARLEALRTPTAPAIAG